MLRNPGLIKRAPKRFKRWWWFNAVRATGVHPRGDQLRLRADTSEKPLSSITTSVADRSRHFFYPWPNPTFPVHNRFLIALDGQPLNLLRTPAHAGQQPPDATGLIAYLEQRPDHMPDPFQCPVVFTVPMGIGAAQQFYLQFLELHLCQIRWFARRSFAFLAGVCDFPSPTFHTPLADAHLPGNLFHRIALFQQFQRLFASLSQLFAGTIGSHDPIMT